MATIPRKLLSDYQKTLEAGSKQFKETLEDELSRFYDANIDRILSGANRAQVLREISAILNAHCQIATSYSANLARQFYDSCRVLQIGDNGYQYEAETIDNRDPEATNGFVEAKFGKLEGFPSKQKFIEDCQSRLGYELKKAAGECVYANGKRDPERVRFARVPGPGSDCKFCLMLASRGFVYRSDSSAGSKGGSHYHDNCHCSITPQFTSAKGKTIKDKAVVEGYDHEALRSEWKAAGGMEKMAAKRQRDRENGVTRSRNDSMYKTEATENTPAFKNFNDIKAYIYEAKDDADLEARYTNLAHIYGYKSKQLQSQSFKNVIKTTRKNF